MNKRTAKIGVASGTITMIIMLILARYGYVEPAPTLSNFYDKNAYWNFTLLEMLMGTIFMWPIVWFVAYKISDKLKPTKPTED